MARPSFWSRRSVFVLAPAVGLVLSALILLVDRQTGLVPLLELRSTAEESRAEVLSLSQEREALLASVRQLRSDPFAIEAAARETLGMVRPGEIVIRWEKDPSSAD